MLLAGKSTEAVEKTRRRAVNSQGGVVDAEKTDGIDNVERMGGMWIVENPATIMIAR